jgi:hypothetical protein
MQAPKASDPVKNAQCQYWLNRTTIGLVNKTNVDYRINGVDEALYDWPLH